MAKTTKLWIADKMKELMKHKAIDKIRVTEICKAAEIERPTFYYHFKDKYDLVAWMIDRNTYAAVDHISVESGTKSMNEMKHDIVFYKRAFEDSPQNDLWKYMLECFVARYTDLAKGKLGTEVLSAQLNYSIRFYCMGAVGMTLEWILYDHVTPAETAMKKIFDAMPEVLRNLFFPA